MKNEQYNKASPNMWVKFLKNSVLGKFALDQLNTLWVKWGQ
jgi:hypothetical protein